MSLRRRSLLVIETDRAVLAKIIGVSRFGLMQAFYSVHSAARRHLAFAVEYEVNLFRGFMMVRSVCTAWRKIHQEKVCHRVGRVNPVSRRRSRSNQKLVKHGRRMASHGLFLDLR